MNWDWFYMLYSTTAIFLVLGMLTWIVSFFVYGIAAAFKEKVAFWLVVFFYAIPTYLMSTFAFVIAYGVSSESGGSYLFWMNGAFLLLYLCVYNWTAQSDAVKKNDFELARMVHYRWNWTWLGLGFYIALNFYPAYAMNSFTMKVYDIIMWAQGITILNWIIAAIAVIYLIYLLFSFVILTFTAVAALASRGRD